MWVNQQRGMDEKKPFLGEESLGIIEFVEMSLDK